MSGGRFAKVLGFTVASIAGAALLGAAVFELIAGLGSSWLRVPAGLVLLGCVYFIRRAAPRERPAPDAPAANPPAAAPIGFAGVPDLELETLVTRAVAELPPEFREQISNLTFVVEDEPPAGKPWLAIYQGIPLTQKSVWRTWEWPHRITLFRGPIRREYGGDPQLLEQEVTRLVRHELAHYFGISDERLVELGAY